MTLKSIICTELSPASESLDEGRMSVEIEGEAPNLEVHNKCVLYLLYLELACVMLKLIAIAPIPPYGKCA